jgi:ATP-dependent RNA/DNA helicase IGHMBP2
MEITQKYFSKLSQLLQLEKEEEIQQFEGLMKNTSIQQRVEMGICWHPLKVVETGFGFGEYPFAVLERTRLKESNHQFASGKSVVLFSSDTQAPDAWKGVLQYVNGDQLKVIFFTDDEPEILDWGKLGVVLMPDENAYRDQESALNLIANAKNCRLAELREILILNKKSSTDIEAIEDFSISKELNSSQEVAVNSIINNQDVCLVHGPPGTGKTTTLIEATRILVSHGEQVLLTAPSNAAVDWLSIKALEKGLNVLRIGNIAKIDEQLENVTLEGHLRIQPGFQDIRKYRKQSAELRRMAGKYKRQFGKAEREQRKLILKEAKSIGKEARAIEEHLIQLCIESADVITCTLLGANHRLLQNREFNTVIIDESAQSPEPACWVPISKANRIVLAGDPFQLPPTIKSEEAAKGGLSITLMEKLLNKVPTHLLDIQYRMNEQIMAFSNKWFYQNKLKADSSVANWSFESQKSLEFIDTAGRGWEEKFNSQSHSISNPEEAQLLFHLINKLISELPDLPISIGVISPYKEQTILLNSILKEIELPDHSFMDIQTVDAFQGQERDVIFVSLVRSNDNHEIGFLKDYRRMNVAMTRAKKKLCIVGDSATLANDKFYKAFVDFCESNNAYHSAWEFDYN